MIALRAWLWCVIGAYKSYHLRQEQGAWFDGYSGQDILILNDFAGDSKMGIPFPTLLGMFDPYSMDIPVKGGFVKLRAKFLIFTSNKHPRDWYNDEGYNMNQLARRFGDGKEKYTGIKFMDTREDQAEFVSWDACDAKWDL